MVARSGAARATLERGGRLTAAEVPLRGWRADVHADDGLHGHLRARDGHGRRRQEDRLQHPEVAFFRDQRAASRVALGAISNYLVP